MTAKKEVIISAKALKKSFSTADTEQTIFENLDLDIYKGDFTVEDDEHSRCNGAKSS